MASKAPGMTEKEWTELVKALALMGGSLFYHTFNSKHSPKGFPDCVAVRELGDGTTKLVFAELKREGGAKVSEHQRMWLDMLSRVSVVESYLWTPDDYKTARDVLLPKGRHTSPFKVPVTPLGARRRKLRQDAINAALSDGECTPEEFAEFLKRELTR